MRVLLILSALAMLAFPVQADAVNEKRLLDEGQAALELQKDDLARELFERALVANPKSVEALIGLGQAHFAQEHKSAAAKFYTLALGIDPDSLDALLGAGLADLSLDRKEQAEKRQDRLLRLCGASCDEYRELRAAILAYTPSEPEMTKAEKADEDSEAEKSE